MDSKGVQVVVVVGMRGVGKTTLCSGAAAELGVEFVDLDETLEQRVGMGCKAYIKANGWPAFREQVSTTFTMATENNAER